MNELTTDTIAWIRRARHAIPKRDRKVILSPPRLVARFARFALARMTGHATHEHADDIDARDPRLVGLLLDFWRIVGARYFRLRVEGIENVPAEGPVLFVGNHNGGLVPTDGFFTALALRERFGDRAFYALVHDFLFQDPLLRSYAQRLGMLRAGANGAHTALAAGHMVIVYPGSDIDTFRPFRDRGKVVLGGRKGFLRLALRERVPIVPVVSVGTHEQLIVLTRGERLARLFHMHAWARTEVFPLVLALPWGLTSGFVPYLPIPAQTTIAFGAPITWPSVTPDEIDDPDIVDGCYGEVESRMQAMLDTLSEGRRPFLGTKAH